MEFRHLEIAGLVEVLPSRHGDARGWFSETFRQDRFDAEIGETRFVQDNQSLSAQRGTIRGLHVQTAPHGQGKLVRCIAGALFDVAVDIRAGSPTFGRWAAVELSAAHGNQLWIPPGFAHGFCTLQPDSAVAYKVTDYYAPACDKGLAWNDPAIGIAWPAVADVETLSAKDRVQPSLAELSRSLAA